MGPPRAARRRGHGRVQPGDPGRRADRGARRTRRLRRLRPGRGGRPGPHARGEEAQPDRPVRRAARGRRRRHRPGMGPYRHRGHRLLGAGSRRRGRLRGPRGAGSAAAGTQAAVRHGMRRRRAGVRPDRPGGGRLRLAADANGHRGGGPALAGGGRHGRWIRLLVRRHATDRRRTRDALLRPDPRRRGLHGTAGRYGDLRGRPGGGQRSGGDRSRAGVRGVRQADGQALSG